jgi:hypothetical protein
VRTPVQRSASVTALELALKPEILTTYTNHETPTLHLHVHRSTGRLVQGYARSTPFGR